MPRVGNRGVVQLQVNEKLLITTTTSENPTIWGLTNIAKISSDG